MIIKEPLRCFILKIDFLKKKNTKREIAAKSLFKLKKKDQQVSGQIENKFNFFEREREICIPKQNIRDTQNTIRNRIVFHSIG